MLVNVVGTEKPERYAPQPGFSICVHEFPRLVMELCSDPLGHTDRYRMLVYGASLVRLANHILKEEGKAQDFVLVAIYMYDTHVELHLLYQKDDSSKVS